MALIFAPGGWMWQQANACYANCILKCTSALILPPDYGRIVLHQPQELASKGILVIEASRDEAESLRKNCEIGHCYISHVCNLDPDRFDGVIICFSDCNYKTVYRCAAKVAPFVAKE
ncbi:MAG: hypothetical protein L3J66_05710 [Bacteroidales bacterium]|nr:hypothetical protein [Bacteroidales bacterium]